SVTETSRLGGEVGAQWNDTSLTVGIFDRLRADVDAGEIRTITAASTAKDVAVVGQQLFGDTAAVSAYWSHGAIALPGDTAGLVAGTMATMFDDRYDRFGAFAAAGAGSLRALAGVQVGFDHARDPSGSTLRFMSRGTFAETDLGFTSHLVGYLRADYVDP